MRIILHFFLAISLFSCWESTVEPYDPGQQVTEEEEDTETDCDDVVTDIYGVKYPTLDPSIIYCGPGWGQKMCHFLTKHDGTTWADPDHYYSDFPDVSFSKFWGPHFISHFKIDSLTSYCEGWKRGENVYDGLKWNITLIKDEENVLWFDYAYYGTSEEIAYTIRYKYEVLGNVLKFSSSNGQSFIYKPSTKNYSGNSIESEEIITTPGCLF